MEVASNITFQNIKNGDKSAFELLFKQYYEHLCNFAYQYLKEKAASEEIVQDVFFKIWEKKEELNIISNIKSYLFSSVRNQCLNQLKHLEIRDNYKSHNEKVIQENENIESDYLVENELSAKINSVIEQLPVERQKIFKLSRFDDKKYKEIAEELGISVKTVEAQMSKALKFIREQLAEYLPILVFIVILIKLSLIE